MEALFKLLLLQLDQSLGACDSHFNLGLVPLVVVSFIAIGSSISLFSFFYSTVIGLDVDSPNSPLEAATSLLLLFVFR